MMRTIKLVFLIIVLGVFSANAQDSKEELAKAAANPLADIMSFPFQNNLNGDYGPHHRNMNILNIQPVIPFAGGKIITRTVLPIVSIPDFSSESGNETWGLGDAGNVFINVRII